MASVQTAQREGRGAIGHALSTFAKLIMWLFAALLLSIVLEWIGITWWWPEQGALHSLQMFRTEINYLATDVRRSLLVDDSATYAANIAQTSYTWIWVKTGLRDAVDWAGQTPAPDANVVRQGLFKIHDYLAATINVTQVFAVRLAILSLAMPVFLLAGLVGLVDGLVERDARKFGGGRESSYVFHIAKQFLTPAIVLSWAIYLAMPVSVHPGWVVLPFAALFGLALKITASTFKKYL